jgi:hypothetical protein
VTTDQRVVAKQEIQEVESAKREGALYSHHRNQAKGTNKNFDRAPSETILRQEALEDWGRVTCVGLLKQYLASICRSPSDEKK